MPTARQQLADRLRALRKDARLGQTVMAERLGISQPLVSYIEKGARSIRAELLGAWLDACGVPADDPARAELADLLEQGGVEITSWEKLQADGWDTHQRRYEAGERTADAVMCYQSSIVPGLLQTAEYVEALMSEVLHVPAEERDTAVAARLRRGGLLWQGQVRLDTVICEHVLRARFCGGAMMAGQCRQIAAAGALDTVELSVLPVDTTMPDAWGAPFTLLEMPDRDTSVVLLETETGQVDITEPRRVAQYRDRYDFYREYAISGQAAIDLVLSIAADHEARHAR